MNTLNFNFDNIIGKIKPMNGVDIGPLRREINQGKLYYLKEANIPYCRLHDVGGYMGGNIYVDIPNIFRDFSADVDDPASYDFAATDILLSNLKENGCEPYYRLGVSIEHTHPIKHYRIDPPTDNDKWARICEHIIRHYNEGWADGFYHNIKYWEIWCEVDANHTGYTNGLWGGTSEEYFELYRVTAKHLRDCFGDSIKIGCSSSSGFYAVIDDKLTGAIAMGSEEGLELWEIRTIGFLDFLEQFLTVVKEENLPLDFFPHHSYASVEDTLRMQKYAEEYLEKKGFGHVEIHLNEWNPNARKEEKGKSVASANLAAMMCAMQDTKLQVLCYYDARIGLSDYSGLFHVLEETPYCTFYSLKAFGNLYLMGNQAEVTGADDGLYVTAAVGDGVKGALLANIGKSREIQTNLPEHTEVYLIDETHHMEKVDVDPTCFICMKNETYYFEVKD